MVVFLLSEPKEQKMRMSFCLIFPVFLSLICQRKLIVQLKTALVAASTCLEDLISVLEFLALLTELTHA